MIRIQRAQWHSISRLAKPIVFLALSSALWAQFRGSSDWSTNGGDAQRSSWVRTDPKINPASIAAPGFQLLWKMKFDNQVEKANSLSAPVLMDRYIGYRGFRTYAFIGGSGENAFAMDSDLGRLEWQKHFPVTVPSGSGACSGGMTAGLTRPVSASFPMTMVSRYGGGRGGPANLRWDNRMKEL